MFKLFLKILLDERGETLSITRKTSNTVITAAGFNTNYDEIEAVVNALTSTNLAADSVTNAQIASSVVRTNFGLVQHTDGTLYVDVSNTKPGLEVNADGGLRVIAAEMINRASNGVTWGRSGDFVFSSSTSTPTNFTDRSATYNNKFMRISSGTVLTEAGSDTHTHTAGSYTVSAHDHGGKTGGVSQTGNPPPSQIAGGSAVPHDHSITQQASATITGTSASGDNVPAYVTLRSYQKD